MQPDDAAVNPGTAPDDRPAPAESTAPRMAMAIPVARAPLWYWSLSAALCAALLSWLGGETTQGHFAPDLQPIPKTKGMSPYERQALMNAQELGKRPIAEAKNSAVSYGLLGALVGAGLGLAGGLARRNPKAGLTAAAMGLVIGAATAAGLSAALVIGVFYPLVTPQTGLFMPLAVHGGIWAGIGAVGGLALGLGLGDRRWVVRALLGGLMGGLLGTVAFEIFNAVQFALIRVETPIPSDRFARLAADLCVALGTALGAVLGVLAGMAAHSKTQVPDLA
jgi:hypothetical protein